MHRQSSCKEQSLFGGPSSPVNSGIPLLPTYSPSQSIRFSQPASKLSGAVKVIIGILIGICVAKIGNVAYQQRLQQIISLDESLSTQDYSPSYVDSLELQPPTSLTNVSTMETDLPPPYKSYLLYAPSSPTPFPHDYWFVKTKKVGGSTLKGMFYSMCMKTGIVCMDMPRENGSLGRWSLIDNREAVIEQFDRYKSYGFKSLAIIDHGVYNHEIDKLYPSGHPLLFTAVREPVARVISHFFFDYRVGGAPNAEDLLTPAMQAYSEGRPLDKKIVDTMADYSKTNANLLFKDIRDRNNEFDAIAAVKAYDFVFVRERFEESIVAFQLRYGLTTEFGFALNAKVQTGLYPPAEYLSEELLDLIGKHNALDSEVYNYANERLDAIVQDLRDAHFEDPALYPDFDEAVEEYKQIQAEIDAQCREFKEWYRVHGFPSTEHFLNNDGGAVGEGWRCVEHVLKNIIASY